MAFSRVSPRVHLDGAEEEAFPLTDHAPKNSRRTDPKAPGAISPSSQQPTALDATRLRRLSFGGGGTPVPQRKMLPALDRAKEGGGGGGGGGPAGALVPLPMERPKFHHGDPRPRRPKVSKKCHLYVLQLRGAIVVLVNTW